MFIFLCVGDKTVPGLRLISAYSVMSTSLNNSTPTLPHPTTNHHPSISPSTPTTVSDWLTTAIKCFYRVQVILRAMNENITVFFLTGTIIWLTSTWGFLRVAILNKWSRKGRESWLYEFNCRERNVLVDFRYFCEILVQEWTILEYKYDNVNVWGLGCSGESVLHECESI